MPPRQNPRFFGKTLSILFVLGAIVVGSVLYLFLHKDGASEVHDVVIPRGTTASKVGEILYREGVIDHPLVFKILLRLTGGAHRVRAGEFRFKNDMRALDALFVLYNDEPIVHPVTLPEGWNVRQWAAILANAQLVNREKFLAAALSPELPKKYGFRLPNAEGILFPDTYAFSKVDGEERILERLVARFKEKVNEPILDEIRAKGLTLEKVLTMASMIEKETGVPEERPLVSSVFWNRIRKGMRLQSDPTTIYGIPNFTGRLTKADLQAYSPYNTYVIPGLPPGPICNPGLAAILAAIHPASTGYFYFVSNNNGRHIFSETYGEHSRHVNTYQKGHVTTTAPSHHLGRLTK